nr:helix-turn-helix domain-containing protein [Endozoicomonas sp. SCSIO W0465]
MHRLNTTQMLALILLASYANAQGECWPSQNTMAKLLNLSRPTVNQCLKKLEQEGFIESLQQRTHGNGMTNKVYRMRFEPFIFKREQRFNCFGQKIDDPRMADTSWADGFE